MIGRCAMSRKARSMHETIGDIFEEALRGRPHYSLIRDKACGGEQRVTLFYTAKKSRETEYCNVDLLVPKGNKIRIIVEIEEACAINVSLLSGLPHVLEGRHVLLFFDVNVDIALQPYAECFGTLFEAAKLLDRKNHFETWFTRPGDTNILKLRSMRRYMCKN